MLFISLFYLKAKVQGQRLHTVCVQNVALLRCLSDKQVTKDKQCSLPTKEVQIADHTTKLEASPPRLILFDCSGD
jgi:hypothetical protein